MPRFLAQELMITFVCQSCRTEKSIQHKAERKGRCYCKTCDQQAQERASPGRTEGYYKRVGKRYRAGAMPPWALS